jgi:hypothetical protein
MSADIESFVYKDHPKSTSSQRCIDERVQTQKEAMQVIKINIIMVEQLKNGEFCAA